MKLEEIKAAVRSGKTVNVGNSLYSVKLHVFPSGEEQWLIVCSANGSAIGLTHADGVTMNAKPEDCYMPGDGSGINPDSLTPHFRNLLREENPSWEVWEIMRWKWEGGYPVFCGKVLGSPEDGDSARPGGSAISRMHADIQRGVWALTHGRAKFHV